MNKNGPINSPIKKKSNGNISSIINEKGKNSNNIAKNEGNNFPKRILLKHDSDFQLYQPAKSKKSIVKIKRKKKKANTHNIKKNTSFCNSSLSNSKNIINIIKNELTPESKDDIMNLTFVHLYSFKSKVDNNELNDLPYLTALLLDKRNILITFINILVLRIEIIKIFFCHEKYSSLIIDLNHLLFSILFEIFMNALLFSDDIISQKYHSNGELDKITILFLSFTSLIISKIFDFIPSTGYISVLVFPNKFGI